MAKKGEILTEQVMVPENEENVPFLSIDPNQVEDSNKKIRPSSLTPVQLASPNSQVKVSYIQEKKLDFRKNERPSTTSPPPKRESLGLFSRPLKSTTKQSPIFMKNKEDKKIQFKNTNPPPFLITPAAESFVRSKGKMGEIRSPRGNHVPNSRVMDRPVQHHTFPSDAADVRQIEKELLQLMDDFETGNLRAFGKHSRLRQMEEIREQQERLARLHFDVGAEQDLYPPLSEDGLRISQENTKTLMEKLAQLSESIESLHSNSPLDRKSITSERKASTSSFTVNDICGTQEQTGSHTINSSSNAQQNNKNNIHPLIHDSVRNKEAKHGSTNSNKPMPALNSTFPKASSKHIDAEVGQLTASHTIPKRNAPPNNSTKPPPHSKKVAPPIPPPPTKQSVNKKTNVEA